MLTSRGGLPRGFHKLVVPPGDHHSAHVVCASSTCWGPELVHLDEQIFCAMDTHMTYPFCDTKGLIEPAGGSFGHLMGFYGGQAVAMWRPARKDI